MGLELQILWTNDNGYKITIVAVNGSSGAIAFDAVDAIIDQGVVNSINLTLSDNVVDNPTNLTFRMNYSLAFASGVLNDTIELMLPYFEAIIAWIYWIRHQQQTSGDTGGLQVELIALFIIYGSRDCTRRGRDLCTNWRLTKSK